MAKASVSMRACELDTLTREQKKKKKKKKNGLTVPAYLLIINQYSISRISNIPYF